MCGKFHTPPPANGASQGNYFLPKSHKLAVFEEKNRKKCAHKISSGSKTCKLFSIGFWFWLDEGSNNQNFETYLFPIDLLKKFCPFCFASPEIIVVKFGNIQTDRQILWHHIRGYVDFFFQLNLLLPYSLGSQGDNSYLYFRTF